MATALKYYFIDMAPFYRKGFSTGITLSCSPATKRTGNFVSLRTRFLSILFLMACKDPIAPISLVLYPISFVCSILGSSELAKSFGISPSMKAGFPHFRFSRLILSAPPFQSHHPGKRWNVPMKNQTISGNLFCECQGDISPSE